MTIMTQTEIREIAEALINASPEEITATKELILASPNGQKLHEEISAELLVLAHEQFADSLGEALSELLELAKKEEEAEEEEAAMILTQMKQQELHEVIARQVREQKLAQSIREQLETPKVDLSALIKNQVEAKSLSAMIAERLEAKEEAEEATVYNLCKTVVDIIFEREMIDLDEDFSLASENITLYAQVFEVLFNELVQEKGYNAFDYEYKPEYTAIILTELVEEIVFDGAELGFKVVDGKVEPVLVA